MDAIETLMNEHRVIEQVLDGLIAFTQEIRRAEKSDEGEELTRFVTFLSEFADACHHAKEERILFSAMVEHGFPQNGGPIAVMLHEHDQGRALVQSLRKRSAQREPWNDAERAEIAEVARQYAQLLRAHIQKEDSVLYPMAEQHLPPEAMKAVADACDAYERDPDRSGSHERLHTLAEELVRRHAPGYGSARPQPHVD